MGEAGCLKDGHFQNLQCVRLNGGTAADELNISNDGANTNIASITGDSLVSGSALDITSSSNAKKAGGLLNISQTGAPAGGATSDFPVALTVSTDTASTHADHADVTVAGAGAASFKADSLVGGTAVSISSDSLGGGSALRVTSATSAKTKGSLVVFAETNPALGTTQEEPTLSVSTTATGWAPRAGGPVCVASFKGDNIKANCAVLVSAGDAVSSADNWADWDDDACALKVVAPESKIALNIQGGIKMVHGATENQGDDGNGKETPVAMDGQCGAILTQPSEIGANGVATFTLTNNCILAGSVILTSMGPSDDTLGATYTPGSYDIIVDDVVGTTSGVGGAAGTCKIHLRNHSSAALSERIKIHFVIINASVAV